MSEQIIINEKGEKECLICGSSFFLKYNCCVCNLSEKIKEYLALINIDLSSATFICFGVGTIPLEALNLEQKFELLDHLILQYEIKISNY